MSLSNYRLVRFLARVAALGRKPGALPLPDPSDPASFKVLLHRPQVHLDTQALKTYYAGKRVMVTGAGGSIGSEIAKQALSLGAAHVSLVDHSELALYEIDRAIRDGFEPEARFGKIEVWRRKDETKVAGTLAQ